MCVCTYVYIIVLLQMYWHYFCWYPITDSNSLIKIHGSESHGRVKHPTQRLPRVYRFDQAYENRSYLYNQFYDLEDT